MRRSAIDWLLEHRGLALELFVLSNLTFLVADIYVAHSVNDFAHPAEWAPLGFSAAGALALGTAIALRLRAPRAAHVTTLAVGALAVLIGVAGLLLHLNSQFFQLKSLHSLVYTAPFAAPLAYCGLGLLLLLGAWEPPGSDGWSAWVVFLALGGFVGNFALSLCDHAQNGFFYPSEWIPVVTSAFAVAFLTVSLWETGAVFVRTAHGVLLVQLVIGVLGFVLHLDSKLQSTPVTLFERVVHGAPVFAPLLLPNLALLAGFGLWSGQHPPAPPLEPRAEPPPRAEDPESD